MIEVPGSNFDFSSELFEVQCDINEYTQNHAAPQHKMSTSGSLDSLPQDVVSVIHAFASVQPCQGRFVRFQQIPSPARSTILFKAFFKSKIIYVIVFDGVFGTPSRQELVIEEIRDTDDTGTPEFRKNCRIHIPIASYHCFFAFTSHNIFIGNIQSQRVEIWDLGCDRINNTDYKGTVNITHSTGDINTDDNNADNYGTHNSHSTVNITHDTHNSHSTVNITHSTNSNDDGIHQHLPRLICDWTLDFPIDHMFQMQFFPDRVYFVSTSRPTVRVFSTDRKPLFAFGDLTLDSDGHCLDARNVYECASGCLIITDRKTHHKLYDHNGIFMNEVHFDDDLFPVNPLIGFVDVIPNINRQLKRVLTASPVLNEFYYPNRDCVGSVFKITVYKMVCDKNMHSFVESREFKCNRKFGKGAIGLPEYPLYMHCLPSGKICCVMHSCSIRLNLDCSIFE